MVIRFLTSSVLYYLYIFMISPLYSKMCLGEGESTRIMIFFLWKNISDSNNYSKQYFCLISERGSLMMARFHLDVPANHGSEPA